MAINIVDFSKRLIRFYQPYFGLKGKALWRSISVGAIFACNLALAIIFSFFNSSMTLLIGVLEHPGLTYGAFFGSFATVLGYLALNICVSLVKNKFIEHLRASLSYAVDKVFLKRWIKNKAYYGLKFIPTKNRGSENEQELNPAQIMSYDNAELIDTLTLLADDFLNIFCLFALGLIGLYSLSEPLTIALFSINFVIPGYMVLGTIFYALTFNLVISFLGHPLKKYEESLKNAQGILYRKSHEIMSYAESIAFLRGTKFEYNSIKDTLKKNEKLKSIATKIRLNLNLFTQFHLNMGFFIPVILGLPSLMAQKMKVAVLYEILPYFQSVVRFLTWKNENYDNVARCEVSLSRMEKFSNLLKNWETLEEKARPQMLTNRQKNTNKIQLKNVTPLNTKGKPLLRNTSFAIERGKAVRIEAASGAGKTTLLRAIADLWPYMQKGGEIVLPNNTKAQFIPQEGLVHHAGRTLLETILYPDNRVASKKEIAEIKSLMKKAALKTFIIENLHRVKDWKKELSGGEKQRIAIISAIVKKPDILFMDEATSALDHSTKKKIEALLKEKLPYTAIGYIDHNPSDEGNMVQSAKQYTPQRDKQFFDNTVTLKKAQKSKKTFLRAK